MESNKNNIIFVVNKFNFENKIKVTKKLGYPFIFFEEGKHYLYYRDDSKKKQPEHEITTRFIINDDLNIIGDKEFILDLGIANHNFRLFNFNNIKYGVGGQSKLFNNYKVFLSTTNPSYNLFNKNIKFLLSKDYGINEVHGGKFIDPNIHCPYHGNGLYLFEFKDDNYKEVIDLPIISGIKEGRHDGNYGFSDNKNLKNSEKGLSVFDASTSILYNEETKDYFLYQRANIGAGIRFIQYCTSKDLINWGDFKLININPKINFFDFNFYYSNFFSLEDINQYIGILPVNKKISSHYTGLSKVENYQLYYSEDCITWNFIGILDSHEYHENFIILGTPIIKNNKYYFYSVNHKDNSLNIFSVLKNRFSYFTNSDKNLKSNINLKLLPVKSNVIKMNMTIFEGGYLKVQLKDKNNNIIEGYTFDNFIKIEGFIDEFDYILKWNNNLELLDKEVYIEIEGMNFNLYSINNKLIYEDLLV